jgi:hypothetical protein
MRDENTMKTRIRILTNENHPTRSQMINRNIYDDYGRKPGSPKPFFIRAAVLGQMDIDGRKVEKTPDYIRPPWYTYDGISMDWYLQELINEKYNDHTRIYNDWSKKEEKVEYAVVTDQQSTRKRTRDQSSIFSAKQEAIIGAIQKLPTTGVKGVIFTNSLSTMMAASGNNHTKTKKTRQFMHKRKENVTLCWV